MPPPRATSALPGSEAKLVVLEERAMLGLALFHKDDAPLDPEAAELGVADQAGLRHCHGRIVDTMGVFGDFAAGSGEDVSSVCGRGSVDGVTWLASGLALIRRSGRCRRLTLFPTCFR